MKKGILRCLLTLILVTSFLVVPMFGCASSSRPAEEESSVVETSTPDVERTESKVLQREFLINGTIKDIGDYMETEEVFLMDFEETYGIGDYELYDASELTAEMLENRNGKTIIERCIGIVTNGEKGDGSLLNYPDPEYYYISYRSVSEEYRDGTIVLSYMVYDPSTNYVDDIMERYDFIICREYED